jgi:threonine/homoserine/homoserine lactone efflux protein
MNIEFLLLYLLTWLLVALTPGPAVLYIMSQTARYGWQVGLRGVVGIQIGNVIFFLCIAFGLVTLLTAITNAFLVLQIAGAAYLLYLGLRIIISSLQRTPRETIPAGQPAEKASDLVLSAVLVQLTNPKALMFVSAFSAAVSRSCATAGVSIGDSFELHRCHRHRCPRIVCFACRSWLPGAPSHRHLEMD